MKKINVYLIVSSLIALVLFIGGCITLITVDLPNVKELLAKSPDFSFILPQERESNILFEPSSESQYTHYYEETFTFAQPDIKFDLVSTNLSIVQTDSADVKLIIHTSNPENYYLESHANSLSFEENRPLCIGLCANQSHTEVILEVPSHVTLNKLDIDSINSVTKLSKLTINYFNFNGVNGPITLSDLSTSFNVIDHINGDIILDAVSFDNFSIDSINSSLMISDVTGDAFNCSVLNGTLNFKDIYVPTISIKKLLGQLTLINADKTYEIQQLTASELKADDVIDATIKQINE